MVVVFWIRSFGLYFPSHPQRTGVLKKLPVLPLGEKLFWKLATILMLTSLDWYLKFILTPLFFFFPDSRFV